MKHHSHATYVAAAVLATLCWGAGMTLTKLALGYFEPSLLLIIQLLASVVFLLGVAVALRLRLPSWQSLSKIWWLGILEPGLAYFLGLEGLKRISAAEAVVLSSTESILVVLLAWLWMRQRPRGIIALLAVVGGIGAVLVASGDLGTPELTPSLVGDVLLMGGVLCAAAYVVLSSRASALTEPLPALIAQQAVAVLLAVGIHVAAGGGSLPVQGIAVSGWVLAAVSGIVQYACAFWFYLWALKGLSAGVAGLYLSLIPVFGLLVAMPVLGDRFSVVEWVGALLIIGSVVALTWVKDDHRRIAAPSARAAPVLRP